MAGDADEDAPVAPLRPDLAVVGAVGVEDREGREEPGWLLHAHHYLPVFEMCRRKCKLGLPSICICVVGFVVRWPWLRGNLSLSKSQG